MYIDYSDDQRMLQEAARGLLNQQVTQEKRQATEESETGYDADLWARMADMGWLAAAEDGEAALPMLGVLAEESGRAALASPLLPVMAASLLLQAAGGAPELLEKIGAGSEIVVSVREPVPARRFSHGVVIERHSQLVEWADSASFFLVRLSMPGGAEALGLVPAGATRRSKVDMFDHHRGAMVEFGGVELLWAMVPSRALKAGVVDGWRDQVRLLNAAALAGAASAALELTVAYTKERVQFGRAIGTFQAIQHGLADARVLNECAWLAVWEGLSSAADGRPMPGAGALASWQALRALQKAAVDGVQYHGGIGYIRDYPMQYYYRLAATGPSRTGSDWDLLGDIATAYVDPFKAAPRRRRPRPAVRTEG